MVMRQLISATVQGPDAAAAADGDQPDGTSDETKESTSSASAADQPLQGILPMALLKKS